MDREDGFYLPEAMSENELSEDPTHERTTSRGTRVWGFVLPGIVLLGLLGWGLLAPGDREQPAPDFELRLLDGGTISSDELRGEPVVLNFWASWCIPCREEMPAFERMWQKYKDSGIRFVGVNVRDSVAGARDFLEKVEVTYPIALDHDNELASQLGVRGLPQTFFIDEAFSFEKLTAEEALEGEGDRVTFGAIDEDELEAEIRELLQESDEP